MERLLKETSNGPSYQPQVSVKEESPEKELLESKQARFWEKVPPFYWSASEALEIKRKSNIFKSQVNLRDRVLGRDKAVTGLSDLCGSESGVEIPGASQLSMDHEVGTTGTINPPEERDSESGVVVVQERAFQEPGFKEAPEAINVPINRQPIPLLTNKENSAKTSQVGLILASLFKRLQKKQEKDFSDSDFSDRNVGSNAESWRNTSSEHFEVFHQLVNELIYVMLT